MLGQCNAQRLSTATNSCFQLLGRARMLSRATNACPELPSKGWMQGILAREKPRSFECVMVAKPLSRAAFGGKLLEYVKASIPRG